MLVVPIPERDFNLYALALPEGPNFEPYVVVSGWKCDNALSVGGVLLNHDNRDFGFIASAVRSTIALLSLPRNSDSSRAKLL
jgi:hypothetical protein